MASDPAIVVRGLVKNYSGRRVVDDLDLTVASGETVAVLGPNGAGKTTTIEILEGFRRPDAGQISVLGRDPIKQASTLTREVGIMPQQGGLYPAITPREALALFAHFYPDPRPPDELLSAVGLAESASTRYRQLSGGEMQRLSLALALLPRARLIFLDEPTAGMDLQARRRTWDLIAELHRDGVTVVLTTHYLEEAEQLADRVAIVDRGRLLAFDTPARLIAGETAVRLRTSSPVDLASLTALPSAASARESSRGYVMETGDAPALLVEITTLLRDRKVQVLELRTGKGSLEDVFLELTGHEFEQ
jgi:ABC-2 type transport system ATP-binding protein